MAIKYLAGERIIGTAAERAALTASSYNTAANTSWKLLGSGSTLSNSDDNIASSTFTAKDNMMVLGFDQDNGSGSTAHVWHFNDDVGSNQYRWAISSNNGSVGRQGDTWIAVGLETGGTVSRTFSVLHFKNLSGQYRIGTGECNHATIGASTAPKRRETTWKWGDNSAAITKVTLSNLNGAGGGSYTAGEVVVLGCDDDEADSGTNFWQELASSSTLTNGILDSGTFTAKRFLMYETVCNVATYNSHSLSTRFNNTHDTTGNLYATRRNGNGSSETYSEVSSDGILSSGMVGQQFFERGWILNRSDGEKLVIIHNSAMLTAANDGYTKQPQRNEVVGKWASNDQVTSIQKRDLQSGGTALTSGHITVWGGEP